MREPVGGWGPAWPVSGSIGMRLRLVRTGGLAGMRLCSDIDTASMPAVEARHLEDLVRSADVRQPPPGIEGNTLSRDHFQYELHVEAEGKEQVIRIAEPNVSEGLKPLIKELVKLAKKGGRS